jgi:hypothetical protein
MKETRARVGFVLNTMERVAVFAVCLLKTGMEQKRQGLFTCIILFHCQRLGKAIKLILSKTFVQFAQTATP